MRIALFVCMLLACAHHSTKPTVDLAFKDAPIEDVLRALAEKARINLDLDGDVTGTVSIDVHGAPWDDVLAMIARDHRLRVQQVGPVWQISDATKPAKPAHTFTGAPIEVDFAETPIRDVAKTFADFAKVPVIVDDDVRLTVTLRIRKLAWDQVLDHIARKYNLRVVPAGAGLRISAAAASAGG